MKKAIEAKNLSKWYYLFNKDYKKLFWVFTQKKGNNKVKKAVDDISFSINQGERVGLIGRNGAGKSTLMSLIAGISYPSSGEINACGKIGSFINLGAGFNAEFTGRENIYYKAEFLGKIDEITDEKIQEIIDFCELGEYFDLPLKTYSSGMKARLGFSLAIFSDPDILILDEVFAVGDKDFKKKSRKKTIEMFKSGKTIVFSSHSTDQIQKFCDRVIYLRNGKIIFDGDVEEGLDLYDPKRNS